nr:DUF1492 domain-containing protein [Eubacterium sp. BL-380-WT-2B]
MLDIDSWQRELEEWQTRAEKITQVVSDMPRGGKALEVDDIVIKMDEIMDNIKKKVSESQKIKLELEIAFEGLNDCILEGLMKYRYINCLDWAQIAIVMGYSEPHCWKLHGKALEKLEVDRQ